jgi:enoyl-CoA hydratase
MTTEVLVIPPVDAVAELRINRAGKRNALDLTVKTQIAAALDDWRDNDAVSVVVISGEGADFAAGSDLNDLAAWTPADHLHLDTDRMWRSLDAFPKPLIAAVAGRAWGGGCELAMACDLRIAERAASFAQPEIRLGICPGAGGVQRLFRLVGRSIGMHMVLTGDAISAEDALRAGLVSEIVETDVRDKAVALALQIAAMPQLAVRTIKQLARHADNLPLSLGLQHERAAFVELSGSPEKQEGMNAFLQKRPPRFSGL